MQSILWELIIIIKKQAGRYDEIWKDDIVGKVSFQYYICAYSDSPTQDKATSLIYTSKYSLVLF